MKVHIVVQLDGWVLERQAREIERRLDYVSVGDQPSRHADINYYMSYALFADKTKFDMCFFTAYQPDHPTLAKRWVDCARECDLAVTAANRYAEQLKEVGVKRIEMITPGFDDKLFYPTLTVGVVGKKDGVTDRKNPELVKKLMEVLPKNVRFVFAGNGWPGRCRMLAYEEMPAFYRRIDVLFLPSKVELSPLPVLEALACGVPVVAPDIGNLDVLPHTEYAIDDVESAKKAILKHFEDKKRLWGSVKDYTWENWAKEHDKLFRSIIKEGG